MLAILVMPIIHVIEELSVFDVSSDMPVGPFQSVIIALTLAPCTYAFLLTIGFGVSFTRKKRPRELAGRGLRLLVLGLGLNLVRGAIPYLVNSAIMGDFDAEMLCGLIFTIDIIQFTGMTYLLLALLRACRVSDVACIPIGILMCFVGQYLTKNVQPDGFWARLLLSPLCFSMETSYFPILNMFIYAASGNLLGILIQRAKKRDLLFRNLLIGGMPALALFLLICHFAGLDIRRFWVYSMFTEDLVTMVFCILIFLLELAVFHYVHRLFGNRMIGRYARFCGVHLNTIYLIHWVLLGFAVFIAFPLLDIPRLSFEAAVLGGILLMIVSIWITSLLPKSMNLAR